MRRPANNRLSLHKSHLEVTGTPLCRAEFDPEEE